MGCVKFFSADIMYYHIPPLHPILSATGLCIQNLTQCFVPQLNEFTINGFVFALQKNWWTKPRFIHGIVDIQSLFPNTASEKMISICADNVKQVKWMPKHHFKQPLLLSVKSSCFLFNGKYYKQVDGVVTSSPKKLSVPVLLL